MPAEPIAQLSAEDYLRCRAEFPTTTHTITVTPGEAADLSDARFNVYLIEDLAAAHRKTDAEIKEDLAKRLARPDNTFGRKHPEVESRGVKKAAEYVLIAAGIIGNLFIIYTLDAEATAFLMNDHKPMEAHTAFHKKPNAFLIGSVIGVVGTLPIMAFQSGFGAAVTKLPPKIVFLTALPGASSALLHFYNALATFERLFGPDFYENSVWAIPCKALFGATGLLSAWAGNVGFFVNDLIAEDGLIRHQIEFQIDSIALGLKAALTLGCSNGFTEPRAKATRTTASGHVAMDDDGVAPRLGAADTKLATEQLDHLRRQINLLLLLAEVYIPDAALRDFFARIDRLIPGKKEKLNFEELQTILHELGKLFRDHDDRTGEVLSAIGNLPLQAASYVLAYYGAIAFMPNANEFLDTILETLNIDPFADNISEFAGFFVFLGWAINLGMQGLTLPSNLFRPLLRAAFAQDHLAKRLVTSLAVLIPSAAVAYNMVGLITQTDGVDNGWDTLIPAAAANLNITAAISGLLQRKITKKPDVLDAFKRTLIRVNQSLQAMRDALTDGQLEDAEVACLVKEVKACLDEFKGRATPTAAHPATDHSSRTGSAKEEAKEGLGSSPHHHVAAEVMTVEPETEVHRRGRGRTTSSAPEAVADLATRRAGLRDERYGRRWSEGHWYSPVANFFRRICYDTYQPAELDDSLVPATKHRR